jgi:hypothetical protein
VHLREHCEEPFDASKKEKRERDGEKRDVESQIKIKKCILKTSQNNRTIILRVCGVTLAMKR